MKKVIFLAAVVLVLAGAIYNTSAVTCLKGSSCGGGSGGCHWYEVCVPAPSSIAVLANCPDPWGYEPGGSACGRCLGLGGVGGFCGPGLAKAACY